MSNQAPTGGERFGQRPGERNADHLERCPAPGGTDSRPCLHTSWNSSREMRPREWFGDAQLLTIMHQEVGQVGDRLSLRYRLRVEEATRITVCEQYAFCVTNGPVVAETSLVCSGFSPR